MVTRTNLTGLALAAACLVACNGILGIDPASRAPDDTGDAASEAGTVDAASDAGDTTRKLDCRTYCTTINKNCTGVFLEYHDDTTCLSLCEHFDLGAAGAETGDNLACRLSHAQKAASDPFTHCPHAGPLGGNQCGQVCTAFCLLAHAVCSDVSPFESEQTCQDACIKNDYHEVVSVDAGDLAFGYDTPKSTTLNCRLEHLENAVVARTDGDRLTHCAHAQLNQTGAHCAVPVVADAGTD